jgi:hypothetical protein
MFRLGQRGSGEGDRSRDKVYPKGGEGVISLEKAKKLKEAGLKWEPKTGDWFYRKDGVIGIVIDVSGGDWWAVFPPDGKEYAYSIAIFLPRLDQLLGEIEKQGFIWVLDVSATNGNKVIGYAMNIATSLDWEDEEEFRSDSPEEAAASALLWILEGGTSK